MQLFIHIIHFFRHHFMLAVIWVMWIIPFYTSYSKEIKDKNAENSEYTLKAKPFMQKVFNYVENSKLHLGQYCSDVYMRHRMYTKKHGPIARYIPGLLRLESGTNEYLTEIRLRYQYRPPGDTDCKIVAYHSTAKYQAPKRFVSMSKFNFQIYDSKLFLDGILNPMHRRNKRFYKYEYQFTAPASKGRPAFVRIDINPRFENDQLVEGYIDVDFKTGAVRNFSFNFRYQLRTFTVTGRTGKYGYNTLMPERMRILTHFKLMGNRINEVYEIYSKHEFLRFCPISKERRSKYDLSSQCMLRVDTTRLINDVSYFDSIRPIPLRKMEKDILANHKLKLNPQPSDIDSIYNEDLASPEAINDSIQKADKDSVKQGDSHINYFYQRTEDILLSSHAFKMGNEGRTQLKLPALITPSRIGWSKTKGFSLKAKAHWDFFLSSKDFEPSIEFNPSIGYSFKQKQVYWELPLYIRFCPGYNGLITFTAGGGEHLYNSKQADDLRNKLQGVEKYDSIVHIIDHYGFHDYRDTHASLDAALSPIPGVRITLGARFHRYALINWNQIADNTGLKRHFTSIGPRLQIEWTPQQYYYWKGPRRIPLYSKYPTLLFNYERGYALGRGQTHYERFEIDAHYRLPLYAMRVLFFRAGAGSYTQRGTECFLNYDFFKFNFMPDNWNDDLTGEFQLLSSRWYNESRYYIRFTGTYESPMLAVSRIPIISRFIQKERVYLNLLSVHSLGFYSELGYGISTHLLDMGTFMSIAPDHSLSFGCKFILKFFDD